jgi:hypothetical protein
LFFGARSNKVSYDFAVNVITVASFKKLLSGLGHTSRNNYNAKKPNAEKKQESQSPDPEK